MYRIARRQLRCNTPLSGRATGLLSTAEGQDLTAGSPLTKRLTNKEHGLLDLVLIASGMASL
jgi:hypothetical protein